MSTFKRVSITDENLDRVTKLAEIKGIKLSEYLDEIINKAIIQEMKDERSNTPIYLWKS